MGPRSPVRLGDKRMTHGNNGTPDDAAETAEVSDAELVIAIRGGDVESFGELFARHQPAALRLAMISVDRATAEDVVSDAFEKLLNALRSGKGPDFAVRPYVLAIVRNGVIDSKRRRYDDPVDPIVNDGARSPLDSVEPDHSLTLAERSVAHQALMGLSERWRAVLWLGEVEGMDRREIAATLGITVDAVSALAFRAREGLRTGYLAAHANVATSEECADITGLLPEYVRGSTTPSQTALVDEHLPDCDACAEAARELAGLNTHLAGFLAPALLGATGWDYLHATQHAGAAAATAAGAAAAASAAATRSLRWAALTGAGALAVVGLAGWLLLAGHPADRVPSAGPTGASSTAPAPAHPVSVPRATSAPSPAPVPPTPPTPPTPPMLTASPSSPFPTPTPSPRPSRRPSSSPSVLPPSVAPTEAPTAAPTAAPSAAPSGTPSGTPGVTPGVTPSTSAPTTADLSLGTASYKRRPGTQMPYHLTIPVDLQGADQAVLTVTVSELTAFQTHTDRDYGPWHCTQTSAAGTTPAELSCRLPTGTASSSLGLDLGGPAGATVSVSLNAAGNEDPDPANNAFSWQMPVLDGS